MKAPINSAPTESHAGMEWSPTDGGLTPMENVTGGERRIQAWPSPDVRSFATLILTAAQPVSVRPCYNQRYTRKYLVKVENVVGFFFFSFLFFFHLLK